MEMQTIEIHGCRYGIGKNPEAAAFAINWAGSRWNPGPSECSAGWALDGSGNPLNLFSIRGRKAVLMPGKNPGFDVDVDIQENAVVVGFTGDHCLEIRLEPTKPVFLSSLLQDVMEICNSNGLDIAMPLGFEAVFTGAEAEASIALIDGKRLEMRAFEASEILAMGFGMIKPEHVPRENRTARALGETLLRFPYGGGVCFAGWGMCKDDHNKSGFLEPETMVMGAWIKVYGMFQG